MGFLIFILCVAVAVIAWSFGYCQGGQDKQTQMLKQSQARQNAIDLLK